MTVDDIRAEVAAAVQAETIHIHRKLDGLLLAVHHILTRHPDMAIHDDILAALTTNDAKLVAAGSNVDALIAAKAAGDAAFGDVLPRVTAQGSAIDALNAKLQTQPVAAAPAAAASEPAAVAAPQVAAGPAVTLAMPAAG